MKRMFEEIVTRKNIRKRKSVEILYEDSRETHDNKSVYFKKEEKWEPANWREMLNNIRMMRSSFDAPVDSMGCEKCVRENELPEVMKFHDPLIFVHITSMLSYKNKYRL